MGQRVQIRIQGDLDHIHVKIVHLESSRVNHCEMMCSAAGATRSSLCPAEAGTSPATAARAQARFKRKFDALPPYAVSIRSRRRSTAPAFRRTRAGRRSRSAPAPLLSFSEVGCTNFRSPLHWGAEASRGGAGEASGQRPGSGAVICRGSWLAPGRGRWPTRNVFQTGQRDRPRGRATADQNCLRRYTPLHEGDAMSQVDLIKRSFDGIDSGASERPGHRRYFTGATLSHQCVPRGCSRNLCDGTFDGTPGSRTGGTPTLRAVSWAE